MRVTIPAASGEIGTIPGSGWQTFVEGLRYLWQRPPILVLALLKASSSVAFGGIEIVQVTFAEETFRIGDDASATLGLIYLAVGLGTGLGPLVARRITGDMPPPMYWAILVAYLAMVSGYLLLGISSTLPLVLVGTFVRTIGTGINWVYASSLLQMLVPRRYLGRVFAFDMAMMTLASSASTLWAGWAADSLGWNPHQIALALGGVSAVMTVGWCLFLVTQVHRPEVVQ